MELLITVGIFGLVSGLIYLIFASKAPVVEEAIQRRLETIGEQRKESASIRLYDSEEVTFWEQVTNFFFGDKEIPTRFNDISTRLHQTGYRADTAVRVHRGVRIF